MHKNRFRGFTLIELLVVIAIIGILSAVVLASLTTARSKGSDAAIQSDLNTIQTQAVIYYDTGSTYGTNDTCTTGLFGDLNVQNAIKAIDGNAGAATCSSASDGSSYFVYAKSQSKPGYFYCVDSTGLSTTTSAAPAGPAC